MFTTDYYIRVGNYRLGLLQEVEVHKSVDLLAQTATIVLPGVIYNQAFRHEEYIKVGDQVSIELGYDGRLREEFTGFLLRIDTDDDTLTLNCEDNMYKTRKPVKDKQFNDTSVKEIARYLLSEIGLSSLECDYDITFQKFVIQGANAFDVLKKLKDDTAAQIYMVGDTLHIHPPYVEKGGDVAYDFAVNIESSDLQYRREEDRRYEVSVECVGIDGKKKKVTLGVTGGEKRVIKVSTPMSEAELRKRGEAEMKYLVYNGYEGSITGWLIPYVEPTWSARLRDNDYEYKNGTYYVTAVTTTLSESGGVRKVELGRKLS